MKQFKVKQSITDRSDDSVRLYLKDVAKIPMITAEEEAELATKAREGDKAAFDKLIKSNLRFVISVAKQYQGNGIPLIDLINTGNIGLCRAGETFDPTKGFKFISYAVWWIRQAIIESLTNESRTIRIPSNQLNLYSKMRKAIAEFEEEHNRVPSDQELCKILGITKKLLFKVKSGNTSTTSIETPFGDEEEGTLLDVLEDKNSKPTDITIQESDKKTELYTLLDKFPPRESDILMMVYGLDGVQQLPYEEIGKKFGLTGERIRQINLYLLDTIRKNYSDLAKELM